MNNSQGSLYRNRARLLTAHAEFLAITAARYHALAQRVGPRFNRRGQLVRPGQKLPFTLDNYRIWIREQCLGSEQGTTRCEYCYWPLDIHTLVLDHRTPLSQGGSLDFGNLAVACKPCNDQKGQMRAEAFMHLRKLVNNPQLFSELDRTDCLGRLQSALKLAIKQRSCFEHPNPERVIPHVRTPKDLHND